MNKTTKISIEDLRLCIELLRQSAERCLEDADFVEEDGNDEEAALFRKNSEDYKRTADQLESALEANDG